MQEELSSDAAGLVVLPGDVVLELPERGRVRLGSGLRVEDTAGTSGRVMVTKAGVLRQATRSNRFWVEGSYGMYYPNVGDFVVGMVEDRHSEGYNVDIGSIRNGSLSALAFEGASRRNRPNMKIGDLVYCRVAETDRDMEPRLVCVDGNGKSNGFGPLPRGYLVQCSTGLSRSLLRSPRAPILEDLSDLGLQFECAVGMNGRIWVSAEDHRTTFLVGNAILNSEFLTPEQTTAMVKTLVSRR